MAGSRAALKDPEHRTSMVHKNSYFDKLTLTWLHAGPCVERIEPGAVAEYGSSWERSCIVKSGKLRYRVVGCFLGKWDEHNPSQTCKSKSRSYQSWHSRNRLLTRRCNS